MLPPQAVTIRVNGQKYSPVVSPEMRRDCGGGEFPRTPTAAQKWGSPLPESAVAPGQTGRVKVASETNCLYDVRLVFADGHEESHRKVDVCKHEHIRVADTGK